VSSELHRRLAISPAGWFRPVDIEAIVAPNPAIILYLAFQ
jgi:hypothetical protein